VTRQAGNAREDVDRVRDASAIERVIGEHLQLKPHGREYVCLCPFHDDHRPSMTVVPGKQIFHCFVCNTGGDVFTFVMKLHKMEFPEALEFLAERAGIELARRGGDETGGGVSRRQLAQAGEMARDFFRSVLRHPVHGEAAREVIRRRGISDEMVEAFGIGAAADRWDGLLLKAQQRGVPIEPLVEAGLLRRRETGGFYDGFRNRLMFPIQDRAGRVIAFGARKIREEDEPKYINSPEHRLFNKSGTLYGLHQAQRSIQAARLAVVTEGYTDTIACHQAGITNVVATLGTALTGEHADELRLLCDTAVLLFDGDEAGMRAADRATGVFFAREIDVRIAVLNRYTDAKDPDELVKRPGIDGAAVLRRAIEESEDLLGFRFARLRRSASGAGVSAMSRLIREELDRLVQLGLGQVPPVRRRLVVKHLASVSGVDEATIAASIPAGRSAPRAPRPEAAPPPPSGELTRAEIVLGCVLGQGELWAGLSARQQDLVKTGEVRSEVLREVSRVVADLSRAGGAPSLARLRDAGCSEAGIEAAAALIQQAERVAGGPGDRLREVLSDCVRRLEEDADRVAPAVETAEALHAAVEQRRRQEAASGRDNRRFPRPRG